MVRRLQRRAALRAENALLGVAVRIAYKRLTDSTVASSEPGNAPAAARDQATALTRALGQLPRELRDAYLLQMEGELTIAEIAAITNSSLETIKTRLHLARTKLREQLSE